MAHGPLVWMAYTCHGEKITRLKVGEATESDPNKPHGRGWCGGIGTSMTSDFLYHHVAAIHAGSHTIGFGPRVHWILFPHVVHEQFRSHLIFLILSQKFAFFGIFGAIFGDFSFFGFGCDLEQISWGKLVLGYVWTWLGWSSSKLLTWAPQIWNFP